MSSFSLKHKLQIYRSIIDTSSFYPFYCRKLTDGKSQQKYLYHDDPQVFETSMDYLVVGSNNTSAMMSDIGDLDSSTTAVDETSPPTEHIYTNSHFKFEVLETTV